MKRYRNVARAWILCAALIVAGWVTGYFAWASGQDAAGFRSGSSYWLAAYSCAAAVPFLALTIAMRRAARRTLRVAGTSLLGLTSVFLAYTASFSFFGGFCIDPGDLCVTDSPSRIAGVAAPLVLVALGLAIELWFLGRERA